MREATGSRSCGDALDVRAERSQPVQCDSEKFRLRVVVKVGVVVVVVVDAGA